MENSEGLAQAMALAGKADQQPRVPRAPIETADTLRAKAKYRLMDSGMHGLIAHEVVESIISAAMLEMANLMRDMLKEAVDSKKEADRG